MANDLNGNPLRFEAAGGIYDTCMKIQLIQWVDDANDLADASDLIFVINGATITLKAQITEGEGTVYYQAGPFHKGIACQNFYVDTIDAGALLVWKE